MTHTTMLLREPGTESSSESSSESGEEAGGKTAPPIRLRNPRWDRERAPAGGKAIASVEADLPEEEWRTRVVFNWWELHADGTRAELGSSDGHILRGRAWGLFRVPGPAAAVPAGAVPGGGAPQGGHGAARRFLFTARHSLSLVVEGPVLETGSRPRGFDGMLLYSPFRGAYLVLENREQAGPWLEEIREMRTLRGGTRRAWEIRDAAERLAALSSLARSSGGMAHLEELLVLASNPDWDAPDPWVYIRARAADRFSGKPAWREPSDPGLQPILDGLANPASGASPCLWLGNGIRQRLLRSMPAVGKAWDWHAPASGPGNPEIIRFGAHAALARCLLGWDGSRATWDFRSRKAMFGANGYASYSIAEGRLSGTWYWPDADGVDLLEHLDGAGHRRRARDPERECRLRCTLEADGGFLADLPLAFALAFPALDTVAVLASTGAACPRTAAGRGRRSGPSRAGILFSWAWRQASDQAFEDLAAPSFRVRGRIGKQPGRDNAGRTLRIGWHRGSFRFEARGDLAVRLGCGTGVSFPLSPEPGADLIGHLLHCLDFHRLDGLEPEAYRACADMHRARLAAGGALMAARIAALHRAPPEALAGAVLERMRSHGLEALESVLSVMASCLDPAVPAECHKLRWVLRHMSETDIPRHPHPRREAAKRRGLEAGLRRFRSFADRSLAADAGDSRPAPVLQAEIERILACVARAQKK